MLGIGLLTLLISLFICAALVLFATQVVIPLIVGTPLWPQFNQRNPLRKQLSEAEEQLELDTEEVLLTEKLNEINRRKAELKGKK
jgi:hypothetical protein